MWLRLREQFHQRKQQSAMAQQIKCQPAWLTRLARLAVRQSDGLVPWRAWRIDADWLSILPAPVRRAA
ncbi:MAG: hypothetical protein DME50_08185 [Verrucomicrobia bacterium]|nr:MAG: hypothetical protein DME50_08185 [Verrucomicrobiota bacterium]